MLEYGNKRLVIKKMNTNNQTRVYWLDIARVFAIIAVVFNHALSRSFSVYINTQAEFMQMSLIGSFIKALLYVFSRLGVPLFLMVSGSLLIRRDYEEKEQLILFLKHNWLGIFRTTEIWLIIMFIFLQAFPNSALRSGGIFTSILTLFGTLLFINQETMVSMWYMSMILLVYLMIPVLSICIKRLGEWYVSLLCFAALIIGMVIPNISVAMEAAGLISPFDLALNISDLFSIYLIYIFAGYSISNGKMSKLKSSFIYSGGVIGLLLTSLFQYWIYSTQVDYSIRYADIGIFFTSIFLFETIRRIGLNGTDSNIYLIITYISRISFAIYFVHICVMTGINGILDNFLHVTGFYEFTILTISSLVIPIIAIWGLSKNRVIRKYLFFIRD